MPSRSCPRRWLPSNGDRDGGAKSLLIDQGLDAGGSERRRSKSTRGELFVIMGLVRIGQVHFRSAASRGWCEPTSGADRLIDGEDILSATPKARLIEMRRSKLGMVFQHFGLFPHMTATRERRLPAEDAGARRKAERRAKRAAEVLANWSDWRAGRTRFPRATVRRSTPTGRHRALAGGRIRTFGSSTSPSRRSIR